MSTFDGNVAEFPEIRIDHFRKDPSSRPALAYFLSHVHSDHLVGLETCISPFVYCSPATREILLRLEKYPHRMNFSKGILERRVQRYRNLRKLLKPIPLETPTVLELAPGRKIRVTLFDANHCVGAVMFLIQDESRAILYTGDIRSEAWWVDSLLRNPILLPYIASTDQPPLKQLDNIYLDTTFASKLDPYVQFPSKASGIMELLRQVSKYPQGTLFYFDAWTFGYEEVWQALSTFLESQIHVDDYRYSLYMSLTYSKEPRAPEAFKLIGAHCGNHFQKGCLSTEQCRIHSCEKGTGCSIWDKSFVRITPIISRYQGEDMCEAGAGGGHGDLNQQNELDIDDLGVFAALMELCSDKLKSQPQLLNSVKKMLMDAMGDPRRKISLDSTELGVDMSGISEQGDDLLDLDDIPMDKLVPALAKVVARNKQNASPGKRSSIPGFTASSELPKQIRFPYSRHSSYSELCMLIEAFKPKDIYPCTVDHRNWTPKQSMEFLFGHIYGSRPPTFSHDQIMLHHYNDKLKADDELELEHAADRGRFGQETQEHEEALTVKHDATSSRNRLPGSNRRRRRSTTDTEDDEEERIAKRRKSQGDFWPPQDVDHYSPPRGRDTNSRRYSDSVPDPHGHASRRADAPSTAGYHTRQEVVDHEMRGDRAPLTNEKRLSPTRQVEEWRRSMSNDHQRRLPVLGGHPTEGLSSQNHRGSHQTEDYRRVSPERGLTPDYHDSSDAEHAVLSQEDLRLAIQQEAYNAALGEGLDWSEIGLVSVNGHQADEVEL